MKSCINKTAEIIKEYAKSDVAPIIMINILLSMVAVTRDIALASYLGTTLYADVFLLAFFLPDMVGMNLLSASIVASCVPLYSQIHARNKGLMGLCAAYTTAFLLLISLFVFGLFDIFRVNIIDVLGSGLSPEAKHLCLDFFAIFLPIIVFAPAAAAGNSLLQAHGRFVVSAFAPVLYNGVYLAGILAMVFLKMPAARGVYVVAYFIVIAVLSMSVLTWGGLFFKGKIKFPAVAVFRSFFDNRAAILEGMRQVLSAFVPYLLILLAAQSVLFSERYLASYLEVGAIAGLNYAYRLAQFPVWVFVAAVGMVILPSMSRSKGLGDTSEFRATFASAFWLVIIVSLPLSIILHVLRVPIVSILLQRGAFGHDSLAITSGILAGYSLAVAGLATEYICHRVCLAMGRMLLPLLTTSLAASTSIALNFFLVNRLGSAGLGYGLAVGATLDAAVLLLALKKRLGLSFKNGMSKVARVLGANLIVLVIALICAYAWNFWPQESGFLVRALYAVLVVLLAGIGYLSGLRYFKII
ncbi:MAG: lipid II flippase MurJ [Peptococcaceae bacterium]|nr:MATE family efflux transporter [Peptococcaceae bacterium]MDH7523973.1 lipid II flippase MurJ [Peptococcaceae bacterium]